MSMITIKEPSELKKYLKEGTDSVYEFKILGILVNVKFKCNIFDTRNKRMHEFGQDGGMVIFKAHSIKGNNIIVDRLEADKIKADSIVSTYVFANKIKAGSIESMNINVDKIKCKVINSLVLQARKIHSDYVDICDLRNCDKLRAKKVTLLSMNGGKIRAKQVSFNNKKEDDCLPITRLRINKTKTEVPSEEDKAQASLKKEQKAQKKPSENSKTSKPKTQTKNKAKNNS